MLQHPSTPSLAGVGYRLAAPARTPFCHYLAEGSQRFGRTDWLLVILQTTSRVEHDMEEDGGRSQSRKKGRSLGAGGDELPAPPSTAQSPPSRRLVDRQQIAAAAHTEGYEEANTGHPSKRRKTPLLFGHGYSYADGIWRTAGKLVSAAADLVIVGRSHHAGALPLKLIFLSSRRSQFMTVLGIATYRFWYGRDPAASSPEPSRGSRVSGASSDSPDEPGARLVPAQTTAHVPSSNSYQESPPSYDSVYTVGSHSTLHSLHATDVPDTPRT